MITYSTVQKKCKQNSVFFVLCSRENSTKFRHEFSSKRWRIFVESNKISLLSWRNFASTEAKFLFAEISPWRKFAPAKFRHSENSHPRNFARAKIRIGDISTKQNFTFFRGLLGTFPTSDVCLRHCDTDMQMLLKPRLQRRRNCFH